MHLTGALLSFCDTIYNQCCTLQLQNYLQSLLRMKSGLFDKIHFLLNTLNDMNSFSFLYFLLSWLLHQLIHYFIQGWGQPYWPGAACVILPALSEYRTLVFHGNLPSIPRYFKDTPEVFFRQIYRIAGGQVSGLPNLKCLVVIDAVCHPLLN